MQNNLKNIMEKSDFFNLTLEIPNLTKEYMLKNKIIPFETFDDCNIFLSTNNDFNLISNIEYLTKKKCKIHIIDEIEYEKLKNQYNFEFIEKQSEKNKVNLFTTELTDDDSNLQVINYLNELIDNAIENEVSDIHIEPFKEIIRIRFRIDGNLKIIDNIDIKLLSIIITRIKILANLDIAERRLPQDGRITFQYSSRDIDLRISTIPTIYGEKIAIRILDSSFKFKSLNSLGLKRKNLEIVNDSIKKLNGLILVCGPTNSGKTSTIYSILKIINSPEINITTLEDPVEYKIDGINQIQINYKTGLEFITTLNYILRQDPDVLGIGELRNEETVKTALRAALTGHFVLSTLHTNDSLSAINRLKDMGAENYLIANSLKLIISQRLVRKLCPYCREKYLEKSFFPTEKYIYRPSGCDKCDNGYKGRTAIFEVLEIDDQLKNLISIGTDYEKLFKAAKENGFITLKEQYNIALEEGITSINEIIKLM